MKVKFKEMNISFVDPPYIALYLQWNYKKPLSKRGKNSFFKILSTKKTE